MSKPIIFSNPAWRLVSAAPTMPPAGPERMASRPWKRSAAVRPPEDCMKSKRGPSSVSAPSAVDTRST